MQYLIDSANLSQIEKAFDLYPMYGVTTNPTLIAKENKEFLPLLCDIRQLIGDENILHVQVIAKQAEEMVKEALYLTSKIGGNLSIKIPVTEQGIKAIKLLKKEGIRTTATAIFTADQALMAAVAGATYLAPYINRIDNISGNGVQVAREICTMIDHYQLDAKILAASFKNVQQVHEVALAGVHSITVNGELLDELITHPLTDVGTEKFIKDWETTFGKKRIL